MGDALVLRDLADIVAIIEGRDAHRLIGQHRLDMDRHGGAGGLLHRLGVALAALEPLLHRPADRQIAVHRIVRRGLVGQRVGLDPALHHFGQDLRGIAEQADRDRHRTLAQHVQRLVDRGRAPVEIAGLEPLRDAAFLAFDGDAMRAGHDRGERLRAAHAAEPRGQDPAAAQVALIMLAAHLGEGLVSALHDALGADIDPGAGRHLAVHHQPLAIQFVEMVPVRPVRHQVRIGDQHARRVAMRAEHADRLARLDEQGLVLLQPLQRLDDRVVALPVARRPADAAIDDQLLRRLGDARDRDCSSASASRLRWSSSGSSARCRWAPDMAAIVASMMHAGSLEPDED